MILGLLMLALLIAGGCGRSVDAPIPVFYTISGTVTVGGAALPNVTITLSGGATGTTTTDESGNYSFTGLLNGDYTVTPSLTDYTFNPSSLNATIDAADITGQDFAATLALPFFAGLYNDGTKNIPCIWTIGDEETTLTALPIPEGDNYGGVAVSPTVTSGNTVYAAGYWSDGENGHPCYWTVNGEETNRIDLPYAPGADDGYAVSIAVSGDTVYVLVSYNNEGVGPCYWTVTGEEKTRVDLPLLEGADKFNVMSIAVSGNKVYAVGYYYVKEDDEDENETPCYWTVTDGVPSDPIPLNLPTLLDISFNQGMALAATTSGNTVYISGYGGFKLFTEKIQYPCYWTVSNGEPSEPILLEMPGGNLLGAAVAGSIVVSGGTVYTAGYFASEGDVMPCYWTGASATTLPTMGGVQATFASPIVVSGGAVYAAGFYYGDEVVRGWYWKENDTTITKLEGDGTHDTAILTSYSMSF